MKKVVLFSLVCVLTMFSCVSKKNADRLQEQKDSLSLALAEKDSIINDVFMSLDGITENLNAIKMRENLITTSLDSGEIRKQKATQISQDIESINQLLIQNRETIARLERSAAMLKRANVKISSLEKLIKEMTIQVEQKDAEIITLREELRQKNVRVGELSNEVKGLNTTVADLAENKTQLEGEVKSQSDIINTAYYIVGSNKELVSKEIVYKSGFIGRTLKINENRSLDSFTQVDTRNFDEVIIGKKDVTLVSSHPAGSYEFVMNDKNVFSSLVIKDKKKFWEYSKVLVISYK